MGPSKIGADNKPSGTRTPNHIEVFAWTWNGRQIFSILYPRHDFLQYKQFRQASNASTVC